MFCKRLLFDRSKIYIAAPKYFCYLRYTHMNIVFVVFTYSRPDNHLSMLCTIASTTLWLSKVLDGGRTVFATFASDGHDGGRIEKAQSSSVVGCWPGREFVSLGPYRFYTIWTLWFWPLVWSRCWWSYIRDGPVLPEIHSRRSIDRWRILMIQRWYMVMASDWTRKKP